MDAVLKLRGRLINIRPMRYTSHGVRAFRTCRALVQCNRGPGIICRRYTCLLSLGQTMPTVDLRPPAAVLLHGQLCAGTTWLINDPRPRPVLSRTYARTRSSALERPSPLHEGGLPTISSRAPSQTPSSSTFSRRLLLTTRAQCTVQQDETPGHRSRT